MREKKLTELILDAFEQNLFAEEKSKATIEKYRRDIKLFVSFVGFNEIDKELVVSYKKYLLNTGYAVRSVNSMLASLNSLFTYLGWLDCKIKYVRIQKQTYCESEQELTKQEYFRLLDAAKKDICMSLIMQTICGTGIRVSELEYFSVSAVKKGKVIINCKNKTRVIFIPKELRKMLLNYTLKYGIKEGPIFITKNGNKINRSNIWTKMKQLCEKANVNPQKVYPHNLRKLFARSFYGIEKDLAKLADVLGHSSIETTRIYIMSTGIEHQEKLNGLGLIKTIEFSSIT